MKIGQLNMRHSPLVGELVMQFLQISDLEVLLIKDAPRIWLMKNMIGPFQILKPTRLDSLTLILVKVTW